MEVRYSVGVNEYSKMSTAQLRSTFLIENLFQKGRIDLIYCETERAIVGSAVPVDAPLRLDASKKEMAVDCFCQSREIGIINIGSQGRITVDGKAYTMERLDGLYIGRGSIEILFEGLCRDDAAKFYIVSYPAHTNYPTEHIRRADANTIELGSQEQANKRTIFQYIHPGGIQSSQLVMGFTVLAAGSVWNTMPAHTHQRRTEVYMYFDVAADSSVFHLMGPPDETRHITVCNEQALISPMWSIHSGVGTKNYSFVWAMGGENQVFSDMDGIAINELK
jgi:4-deoxy-L-threo-5-hexosulose-uronate ketol-isomerase